MSVFICITEVHACIETTIWSQVLIMADTSGYRRVYLIFTEYFIIPVYGTGTGTDLSICFAVIYFNKAWRIVVLMIQPMIIYLEGPWGSNMGVA